MSLIRRRRWSKNRWSSLSRPAVGRSTVVSSPARQGPRSVRRPASCSRTVSRRSQRFHAGTGRRRGLVAACPGAAGGPPPQAARKKRLPALSRATNAWCVREARERGNDCGRLRSIRPLRPEGWPAVAVPSEVPPVNLILVGVPEKLRVHRKCIIQGLVQDHIEQDPDWGGEECEQPHRVPAVPVPCDQSFVQPYR